MQVGGQGLPVLGFLLRVDGPDHDGDHRDALPALEYLYVGCDLEWQRT